MILNEKVKFYFFLFAKIVIALVAFYFIYQKMSIQPWLEIQTKFNNLDKLNLILILPISLLSVFNWMSEVFKWKVLSEQIKPISYKESFRIVLSSFAVSTITPNRVGEYGAKIMYYNKSDWKEVLSYNFLGNMMQLLITLLMVVISYIYLPSSLLNKLPDIGYITILVFSIILSLFLFRRNNKVSIPWISKDIKSALWDGISLNSRLRVLKISLFKYLAFSLQFMLLLSTFNGEYSLSFLPIIALYYLITSIIPTIFISDILVKGSTSLLLFSFVAINEFTIIAVVLLAWIFNFVLPTIIGVYYLFRKKSD